MVCVSTDRHVHFHGQQNGQTMVMFCSSVTDFTTLTVNVISKITNTKSIPVIQIIDYF